MKVKDLQSFLSKLDPEKHICALIFEKASFEYSPDDEVEITDENWEKVCKEFDESPFPSGIWEFISTAVSDYATDKE